MENCARVAEFYKKFKNNTLLNKEIFSTKIEMV